MAKIIHYCHSPTRYLHGLVTETDHQSLPRLFRLVLPIFIFFLKRLDLDAVRRLQQKQAIWFGNSSFVRDTITQVYRVQAGVLYPPIDLEHFWQLPKQINWQKPFYFYFGRISFHKRIDLIIQACLKTRRRLLICGISALPKQMLDLQKMVKDWEEKNQEQAQIEFLGRLSDADRDQYLIQARAFLFPGKEDFGIAPVEALASGTPVLAYKAGGALEYVQELLWQDGKVQKEGNGLFFAEQTVDCVCKVLDHFENIPQEAWNEEFIRQSVKEFSSQNFEKNLRQIVGF